MAVKIIASILACDFLRLGEQLEEAENAGVDGFQVDVMDGSFVPNISLGVPLVEAVRRGTELPVEAHLMVERPERYVETFAKAGADTIIVHAEATPNLHRTIQAIKNAGRKAGIAINPATPAAALSEILPDADLVLAMTVNPGFGGQKFIEKTLRKISEIRRLVSEQNLNCEIEVDGGIDSKTAPRTVRAGANLLVAGTSVFGAPDGVSEAVRVLRESVAGEIAPL